MVRFANHAASEGVHHRSLQKTKQGNMNEPAENPAEGEHASGESTSPAMDAGYAANTELGFDPLKELNLPSSYEEVRQRFHRLQGGKVTDLLN